MKKNSSTVKKFIHAFLVLILFNASLQIFAQTGESERAEIFEQVWQIINEKYYDAGFNGVDWKRVGEKYRARLKKISGDKDFYILLDQMAGELRDSHMRVYSPEQKAERKNRTRTSVGIQIKEIENAIVISNVAPDSEAERFGIKEGMIVRSINDVPVKKAITDAKRAVGASSSERSTALRLFSKLLAGEPETFLKIGLRDEKGNSKNFTLKRISASSAPQISSRILPSGIAYLKFDQFDKSLETKITNALENFKDAPALILDLRGNTGGDGEMGLRFLGRFFDKKITVAKIITRTGKPPIEGMPMTLETGETGRQIFAKPLAVLIDERTASTAELIANALQETGRATIFGTNSCGCVLAFLDYKPLAGGGDMTLSEFGFITPNGNRLEGAGVLPDRIVLPKLEDIRNGRDAALETAEKILAENNVGSFFSASNGEAKTTLRSLKPYSHFFLFFAGKPQRAG